MRQTFSWRVMPNCPSVFARIYMKVDATTLSVLRDTSVSKDNNQRLLIALTKNLSIY